MEQEQMTLLTSANKQTSILKFLFSYNKNLLVNPIPKADLPVVTVVTSLKFLFLMITDC